MLSTVNSCLDDIKKVHLLMSLLGLCSHVLPAVLSFVNSCLDDIKKVHLLLPKECTGAVQQCTAGCAVFRKLLLGLKESIFVIKECTGTVQQCTAGCGVHRELLLG